MSRKTPSSIPVEDRFFYLRQMESWIKVARGIVAVSAHMEAVSRNELVQ